MKRLRITLLLALCALCCLWTVAALAAAAKPLVHPLFCDNMVLQRDKKDPVWGWAAPGTKVTVAMEKQQGFATADAAGKWQATIGPFAAGGPYEMTITTPEQTLTLKNILVGDVWLCSGQSNMEFGMGLLNNPNDEIAKADNAQIRLLSVQHACEMTPQDTFTGNWQVCTPQNAGQGIWGGFSAVAYFFGREIQQQEHVPIGLIQSAWGGTPAQAWTSMEALKTVPLYAGQATAMEQMQADPAKTETEYRQAMAAYWKRYDPGTAANWADPAFDSSAWKTMNLPGSWENANVGLPDFDGILWYRKEIDVPAEWAGKDLLLHLGPIDDRDTTFLNGVEIGSTDEWTLQRNYTVPGKLVKAGKNLIAIRILDTGGGGGLYGNADQLKLELPGNVTSIQLAGPWLYQVSTPLNAMGTAPVKITQAQSYNGCTLYNGMIAPLTPFAIKGAIWYQGEANAGEHAAYKQLLSTMITDWRARFGVGDFPFYLVQLANFMTPQQAPEDTDWARLREAQTQTVQTLPHCGMALAIDIGDAADIHPKNKQEVGRRLALNALALTYGKKIEYSGPVYQSMQVDGNKICLTFTHAGGGLVPKGDKLIGFAIAGEDMQFVWGDAVIDGNTVIVSSPTIAKPVAVRYAWGNNPLCNLYNGAGLPAVPFRTDTK